jgi:hypothetical protein
MYMIRRTLGALVALGATAALLAVPVQAGAAPVSDRYEIAAADCPVPFWGTFCSLPYLATGFGPVAQATQLNSSTSEARSGKYSPVTGEFLPETDWMTVTGQRLWELEAKATDGVVAPIKGYARVHHPVVGDVLYATQYFFTHARWGVFSFETKLFNPTDPWYPVVR